MALPNRAAAQSGADVNKNTTVAAVVVSGDVLVAGETDQERPLGAENTVAVVLANSLSTGGEGPELLKVASRDRGLAQDGAVGGHALDRSGLGQMELDAIRLRLSGGEVWDR